MTSARNSFAPRGGPKGDERLEDEVGGDGGWLVEVICVDLADGPA